MQQQEISPGTIEELLVGKAPANIAALRAITTGTQPLTDFISRHYFDGYLPAGGSKIKFITGRPGAGKTHLSRLLSGKAGEQGYLSVSFSARDVCLYDFREIYLEILRQCDIERVLRGCADEIIKKMDHDPTLIPEGKNFMDYLFEKGEADAISRSEIRSSLRTFFTRNPRLDNGFACCCSLLTGNMLGHPVLEPANKELLLAHLYGDKSIKLSQLRALGLSPNRITKYNARHLLRSLCDVVRLGGYKGIVVCVDDLEVLLDKTAQYGVKYTKLRRDDAYESIRELIDDIDSLRNILFLFSFDRQLIDDENAGIKSYQALWMRIQNEVVSSRFNYFADMMDVDRYADQAYTPEVLCEMSARLADLLMRSGHGAKPIEEADVQKLMERSTYGALGLAFLVNRAVVEGEG